MSLQPDCIEKFREAVRRFSLFKKGESLLIALSGGPDSVVLTHLLKRIEKEFELELFAVHVDHRLRGDESSREAVWVREFC
ncbi:MAG: ATP-binding protein, partial [bacterium]|nr:ATP-binding protein [bacterium]